MLTHINQAITSILTLFSHTWIRTLETISARLSSFHCLVQMQHQSSFIFKLHFFHSFLLWGVSNPLGERESKMQLFRSLEGEKSDSPRERFSIPNDTFLFLLFQTMSSYASFVLGCQEEKVGKLPIGAAASRSE